MNSTAALVPEVPFPTGRSTVEEAMKWALHQSLKESDKQTETQIKELREELEAGIRELMQAHEQASGNSENMNPGTNKMPQEVSSVQPVKAQQTLEVDKSLKVDVISGVHAGKQFVITPKAGLPCWMGRSRGKKFKNNGISLPRDNEVSTTHGKFTVDNGKFCFTDTGSSNGSYVDDQPLETDTPVNIFNGMELLVGQSIIKITFDK